MSPCKLLLTIVLATAASGCFTMRPSEGGGQTEFERPRQVDPRDIALPPGYRIEAVATRLTFPTGVAFDEQNRPYVTEAGYSYGEVFTTPRLLRIEPDGRTTVIASGDKETAPWTGVQFNDSDGAFYLAQGGEIAGGRIVRIDPASGNVATLVQDLPSRGDHHTNGPAIGADGWIYFGVGVATNSGVVGTDNHDLGWLKRFPDFHDVPARDIKLAGQNFTTPNPLTEEPDDEAVTGAFVPFGTRTSPGQVIEGRVPCTGAILRVRTDGDTPQLVAWGLRNPFGLAFNARGELFVTENQFDVRGSRPIWGTGDLLWRIDLNQLGLWYGWPDFHGGEPVTWHEHYQAPDQPPPQFLLAEHPNPPPQPVARLGVHGSANGLHFSASDSFGFAGHAFIAVFGDQAPKVGKVMAPVGYKVVRVETDTGAIHTFAANRGKKNGPASKLKTGGLERPVAVRFDRTGEALYVVDFGVFIVEEHGMYPKEKTGVLWRITRGGGAR